MTENLFHLDSYLKEFKAVVKEIDLEFNAVCLDRTAFYPGGGGQPNDVGILKTSGSLFPIRQVKRHDGEIWHSIEGNISNFIPGDLVIGELDWDRRYRLMRTHTALHILCGVVFRDYDALVTGGDMEPLKGRMDFEFETLTGDLVREIEASINNEIGQNRQIIVRILPREQAFQIPDLIRTKINLLPPGIPEIRTVELQGLDLQADGGTHVHSTAEVGHVRVVDYKSKGRINKRLYIELD